MVFYTADLHILHAKIIRLTNRPFRSADEMRRELIQRYRACVSDEDTCYFLGDLFVAPRNGKPHGEESILDCLPGHKILLIGNHDDDLIRSVDLSKYFEQVAECLNIVDNGHPITLAHVPMADAPALREGGFMIHGHLHTTPFSGGETWSDRILNACVEVNNYAPATLDQLIFNNRTYKWIS